MDKIDLILKTSKAGTMSTSVNHTVSEYMNFYIRDYALFTETEKDSPILRGIKEHPLVYITLGGNADAADRLEVIGEIEVVTDQDIIDWLAQQKGPLTVATNMVMLKVMALKVKLVEE
ncbi:general stress protein 26 [Salinicoccus halitifaciens]|uniref:General stress protein 26 n=2 Tax=Salinicoccus halitifaciens TaxID=1073415 RepID=A0ABV2EC99_9STAP